MPDLARPAVVLIGAPGAGKTRLGKRLARLLDLPFVDTDKTIVAEHGAIATMFEQHGEAYFRAIEREHVARALAGSGIVALGGGAVLDAETQADLADHRVLLLTVTPEAVERRIAGSKRPLVRDGLGAWVALVEARTPLYERLATRSVDTSNRPLDHIATELLGWLQEERT